MEVVLKVPATMDHVLFLFLIMECRLCSTSLLTIDAVVLLSNSILITRIFSSELLFSVRILQEIWTFEVLLAYIF